MNVRALALCGVAFSIACGSPAQQVTVPNNGSPSASATTAELPQPASIVHFDDVGLSFAVPPGYHVVGDDELAARIRASANPRLQSDLQKHAAEKKGLPLLTLAKENTETGDPLNVALSIVVVPADATPMELMAQQQAVMTENLGKFEVTSPAKERSLDGVAGVEMSTHYVLDKAGTVRVASRTRLFVRNGLATLVTAVWSEKNASRAGEAAQVLDGLHFQPLPKQ